MQNFKKLFFFLIILTSCEKGERKYYESKVGQIDLRMEVKRSVSNTVLDYLEIHLSKEMNDKYDSTSIRNESNQKIAIVKYSYQSGYHTFIVHDSYELHKKNKLIYLVLFKDGKERKLIKMFRKSKYYRKRFSLH
ncbi:hypothetical protein [Fluviicola taffensis]|uniref:hypothetical protein n=1 Tax=Fluviicola taffensis TaxID=191579 RepID=UPI003137B6BF